jgi:hypothetical protein
MQSRVTISIPRELVEAADRRAKDIDRSRSWVLTEALRRYLGQLSSVRGVREEATTAYAVAPERSVGGDEPAADAAAEIQAARARRLRSELALPALERLRRAEELARLGAPPTESGVSLQVLGFDTYEAYYEWKKNRLIRL